MPTYEFLCLDHGHRFEVFQRIGEDPIETCRECGGPVRKVFHPVGVVLKGSGFYKTDNRGSSGTAGSEPKKAEPAAKDGGTKDTKSGTEAAPKDAKPAKKSEERSA